jgi:hypothetical protein
MTPSPAHPHESSGNRIVEYVTACESNLKDLDRRVNILMDQSFQPFGSPYVAAKGGDFNICQPMVKYAADKLSGQAKKGSRCTSEASGRCGTESQKHPSDPSPR